MTKPPRITRRDGLTLLVAAVAGLGVARLLQEAVPVGRDVGTNPTARAALADDASPHRVIGAPTLTVVIFTDYQCPACKVAGPAFDAAAVRDGHIRLVYRDWPIFGSWSERAARVAIAADRQGIYATLHRTLMAEARPLDDGVLRAAVERSGGRWDQVERDLAEHGRDIDRRIERAKADAFALGIAGTPAYLIGPLLVVGAQGEAGFAKAFAQARAAMR